MASRPQAEDLPLVRQLQAGARAAIGAGVFGGGTAGGKVLRGGTLGGVAFGGT